MGILGMERPLYLSIFDLQRRTLRRYTGREAWDLSQEHEGIDALENSQDPSTHLWTIVMSGWRHGMVCIDPPGEDWC
jgi:hypothetical protein